MSDDNTPEKIPPPATDEFASAAVKPEDGQDTLRGAFWLILGAMIGIGTWTIVKTLGQELPSIEIAWFRALAGMIVIIPFVLRTGLSGFRTEHPGMHIVRGVNASAILALAFYAITALPIAQVTSISFSRPLFLLVLAMLILNEKIRAHRAIATVVGFIGVLIIVRPGADMHPAMIAALTNAVLTAFGVILIKIMSRTERIGTMIFYVTLTQTVVLAIPTYFYWQTPTWEQLLLLSGMGVTGTLLQACMVRAYRAAEASALAPFEYTRLIFASLVGYFVFDEVVDNYTWAGAALLICATFYIARREMILKREGKEEGSIDSA